MKFFNGYVRAKNRSVGDSKVSPIDYFKFPYDIERVNVSNWEKYRNRIKDNTFILGGGGLFHLPSLSYANGVMEGLRDEKKVAKYIIGWGLGTNVYGTTKLVYPDNCLKDFILLGVRDTPTPSNCEYVPCASCMDKRFLKEYKKTEDVVLFEHIGLEIPFNYPKVNIHNTFEDVFSLLSKSRVIVTNSYHGAYWGMLLGRKVIVYKPFSSKYYGIHPNVQFLESSDIVDLNKKIDEAKVDISFLKKCCDANEKFFIEVCKTMEKVNKL